MSGFDFRAQLDPMRGLLGGGARRPVRPAAPPVASKSTSLAPPPVETVSRVAPVPPVTTPPPRPRSAAVRSPVAGLPHASENTPARLTLREKILVAALSLGASGFEVEELVVACWRRWPESFGLRGYTALHPNNVAVLCKLAGAEGLVDRGLIERLTPSRYQLTRAGRRRANELAPLAATLTPLPPPVCPAPTEGS